MRDEQLRRLLGAIRNAIVDALGELAATTYIGKIYTYIRNISPQTTFAECRSCNTSIRYFEPVCSVCSTTQDWSGSITCPNCSTEFGMSNDHLDSTKGQTISEICSECGNSIWKAIIEKVLDLDPHENMIVNKMSVPDPETAGFTEEVGDPTGQQADYRTVSPYDQRGIHVKEYENAYYIHWDKYAPSEDRIAHIIEDTKYWWELLAIVVYALYQLITGRNDIEQILRALGPVLPGGSNWEQQFNGFWKVLSDND